MFAVVQVGRIRDVGIELAIELGIAWGGSVMAGQASREFGLT